MAQVVRALGSFDAVLAHFEAVAAQMDAADWEALRKVRPGRAGRRACACVHACVCGFPNWGVQLPPAGLASGHQ